MNPRLQVKICGLTRPDQAAAVAAAGAAAIGLVFHAASPRCVTADQARAIVAALPPGFPAVGVFAGTPAGEIAAAAQAAGLNQVQLHGTGETPAEAETLLARGLRVILAVRAAGPALLTEADRWPESCFLLVECGSGPLPGGNGKAWDWRTAAPLAARRPFILAGGLTPENAAEAARAAHSSALDLSSGVEDRPGIKNLAKIRLLLENTSRIPITWPVRPPWGPRAGPKG